MREVWEGGGWRGGVGVGGVGEWFVGRRGGGGVGFWWGGWGKGKEGGERRRAWEDEVTDMTRWHKSITPNPFP